MTILADELINLLDNSPEEWTMGNHTLNHGRDVRIWIASGQMFAQLYEPFKSDFGFIDRWKLWRAVKRWRNRSIVRWKLAKS